GVAVAFPPRLKGTPRILLGWRVAWACGHRRCPPMGAYLGIAHPAVCAAGNNLPTNTGLVAAGRRHRPAGSPPRQLPGFRPAISGLLGRNSRRERLGLWLFRRAALFASADTRRLDGGRDLLLECRGSLGRLGKVDLQWCAVLIGEEVEGFETVNE